MIEPPQITQLTRLAELLLEAWDVNPQWWEQHLPIQVVWQITAIRGVPEHAT